MSSSRIPAVYLSHGAPPLADDPIWPGELAAWAKALPRPESILVISAHWENAPTSVSATRTVPLYYDFWGFPKHYYEVTYPAPGAPALAEAVRKLLGGQVHEHADRGLDHGAYVPLVEMYPQADVPVIQLSMPTLNPRELMNLGRKLAPLRDEGVLIMGSGFFTHNLREFVFEGPVPEWSRDFDDWGRDVLAGGDVDALLDFQHKAPAAHTAHPRTEHFAPLFVTLGAGESDLAGQRPVIEGFWGGLAKRSVQLG
jgi:4,5-DOPA dioxygenase extradiol